LEQWWKWKKDFFEQSSSILPDPQFTLTCPRLHPQLWVSALPARRKSISGFFGVRHPLLVQDHVPAVWTFAGAKKKSIFAGNLVQS
jgi:hypothetical protein